MLPDWKYATDAQLAYIKRLRNLAFAKRIDPEYGPASGKYGRPLRTDASNEIEMLKRCLNQAGATP